MEESKSQQIDDLFTKIRLQLVKLRESDPGVTEEIKNLIHQVEDCIEPLVLDSLKLESLERQQKQKKSAARGKSKKK